MTRYSLGCISIILVVFMLSLILAKQYYSTKQYTVQLENYDKLSVVRTAILEYREQHGALPGTFADLVPAHIDTPGALTDRWGHSLLYDTDGRNWALSSPGRDGEGSHEVGEGRFVVDSITIWNGKAVQLTKRSSHPPVSFDIAALLDPARRGAVYDGYRRELTAPPEPGRELSRRAIRRREALVRTLFWIGTPEGFAILRDVRADRRQPRSVRRLAEDVLSWKGGAGPPLVENE